MPKPEAPQLIAYLGKPALKDFVLGQLAQHRVADRLLQGYGYYKDGKGCAVGCTIEAVRHFNGNAGKNLDHSRHALYEPELGIPQVLARLEDKIFESLDRDAAKAWPERFTAAIRPGANLTLVWPQFALWLFSEELPQYAKRPATVAALAGVAALYREWTEGVKPEVSRWVSARHATADATAYAADADAAAAAYADAAADAAADDAAYADAAYAADAADAAYADAAYAAAYAADAAYATAYAADAAYATADAKKSRLAYWHRAADKLVELLGAA